MSSLPTARSVYVDELLTTYANAYGQEMTDFIADIASTIVRVQDRSGKYNVWNKADFFRSEMVEWADGTRSEQAGQRLSQDEYLCKDYKLSSGLTWRKQKNSKVDLKKSTVKYLVGQAKLKRDKLWVSKFFATGLWTSNTEQVGKSSNPSTDEFLRWDEDNSEPIKNVRDQLRVIRTSTGKTPNVGVTNGKVFDTLCQHASITDLYKHTQGGLPTEDLVAKVLGLEKLVVAKASQNTAKEAATATMADVFGDHMLLAYIAPSETTEDATAITGFSWNEYDKVDANGAAIRTWSEEPIETDFLEAMMSVDFKLTCNDLGVFLKDCVS